MPISTSSPQQSGGGERQGVLLCAVGIGIQWLLELDNGVAEPSEGLVVADRKRAWRVLPAKETHTLPPRKKEPSAA